MSRLENADWRIKPCRRCGAQVMLWWRYCPFCGQQLPVDGKETDEKLP
jgi:predicted amidophosphoribosyltransferase